MQFNFKKAGTAIFFSILFCVFLNTLSFAKEAPGKNFVPPLVLTDYSTESLITNAGSLSGGDEELPGTLYATIAVDNGFRRGESGAAVRLDYDVSKPGDYSFYWMKLGKQLRGKSDATQAIDLAQYNYISFWIKGTPDLSKVKVEMHQDVDTNGMFVFGKDISSFVYTNPYMNGNIDSNWKKVIIPLSAFAAIKDWSKTLELVFVFENKNDTPKGSVYIDDIIFGCRPSLTLPAEGAVEIKAPVEDSLKVNGVGSKQCLTFKGVNTMVINAQSIQDNPFIESVWFEYSVDKGTVWRTIGTDYDVSKRTYKVDWHPDNSRELSRHEVRAVASDIWGNEKHTNILIDCPVQPMSDDEFLDMIERKSFDFFNDHQDAKTGLFADTTGGGDASIASTGFGVAALCIGAQRGWITKEDAQKRVALALDAFLPSPDGHGPLAEGKYGFFYHFLNPHDGKRAGKSEISTVDTAILVAGALTAGEYFGGEIKTKAAQLYSRVEWDKFLSKDYPVKNMFSMGWSPERGFLESYWDYYTDEGVLITLLAIGSPTHSTGPEVFYAWTRQKGSYANGAEFIHSWHGALFSYQYANAWFNFQNMVDKQGVNWFENSTNATISNRQFCIDNSEKFKGFGPNSWGITSMARPEGYTMHFGPPPTGNGEPEYDGTLSPTGPAGSIVFTPYLSLSALKYMYLNYPKLWGQYGLRDSFNLDKNWYSPIYYGIGEAMILLPVENFRTGFIWKYFMKNVYIEEALKKAGFTKVQKRR
ncbi:MAG: glucoamylase family protein [Candidatus Omnitrophota bacterium]|nr:glucoamylase family protein [Candidatus Omnitrophota bacterium]